MAADTTWAAFFIAASGVLAALAGLLFVAISINLDHILETRGLHLVGLQAVTTLIFALILCLSVLMPGLSTTAFLLELVASSAVLLTLAVVTTRPMVRMMDRRPLVVRALSNVAVIGMLIGTAFAPDRGGALAWLAAAVLVSILFASFNAWALLVLIELDNPARRRVRS